MTPTTFKWKLDRPLAAFDIEATGATPRADRIVELAITRIHPDNHRDTHVYRVNPGMPIPPEATRIHGITDADVAGSPLFAAIARDVLALLENCDLAGYNVERFDIPMLQEEFIRAGLRFELEGRRVIDAQRIYHRRVPRDLTAALAYYCNEMHIDAHGAEADVLATIRVLEAQLDRYPDLPRDLDALHDYCNPRDPSWADRTGKLKWADGVVVLNFGKKKGMPLRELVRDDPGFVRWMLRSDFPRDTKDLLENALVGQWPTPPPIPPAEDAAAAVEG
jgi:DNA polymerase-3 subunit epsilon